jgi:hypothetical protein
MWMLLVKKHRVCEVHHKWKKTQTKMSDMLEIFPDVKGVLEAAPKSWSANMGRFAQMSKHIPVSMHFRWTCLFGYATNPKHTGNSHFCEWVKKFIREAANEQEDGVANAEGGDGVEDEHVDLEFSQVDTWPKTKVFERCRALLDRERGGVPPTPLMVLRKCEEVLRSHDTTRPAKRRRQAPRPPPF